MARKVSLPVTDNLLDAVGKPTLTAMRAKLGGRAEDAGTGAGGLSVGSIVALLPTDGAPLPTSATPTREGMRVGIVLSLGALDVDVYLTRGMVKRTLPSLLVPHDPESEGEVPKDLAELRPSVESFARLREGQKVFFERTPGAISEGTLLEKCRYGALVGDADGRVLGVGFRKLFDSVPTAPNAN